MTVCLLWETVEIVVIAVLLGSLVVIPIDLVAGNGEGEKLCHLVERIALPDACMGTCKENLTCTETASSNYMIFWEQAESCGCIGISIVSPHVTTETPGGIVTPRPDIEEPRQ